MSAKPKKSQGPKYLRVGVMTDYRYTPREFDKLVELQEQGWKPFVNSNGNTVVGPLPEGVPAIVTVNPDGVRFVPPIGEIASVKALRFKWYSTRREDVHAEFQEAMTWASDFHIPLLVTPMRFKQRATGDSLGWIPEHYEWRACWYRLKPEQRLDVNRWVTDAGVYVCDESGKGCPSCQNCTKLTFGVTGQPIWGMDLKASGMCPYACPDCWAKYIIKRSGGKIAWDKPRMNEKQKGKTNHAGNTEQSPTGQP